MIAIAIVIATLIVPPLRADDVAEPGATPPIEHPEGLHRFGAALRGLGDHGVVRVTHLGDSSIGMDGLPHALRTRFQRAYGDAGPGFVRLAPHGGSYRNRTVDVRVGPDWQLCAVIRRCHRDGHYGLAGFTASSRRGAHTIVTPREERTVSRAELWYLAQPRGGRLRFAFGDDVHADIDTSAAELEDRWHVLERAPGAHRVAVRALGGGVARAYGVVLENEGPGVVWDTLPVVGAFTHRLLAHDEAHFAAQLARRDPDLVVLSYGGNDLRRLINEVVTAEGLEEETHRLLTRVREAVPDAGCLLVGISDHERSGEREVSPVHVRTVLAAQRAAAGRAGCAFWDTTAAMGGAGSFDDWRRRGLAAGDLKHLTERGRRVIAARLSAALIDAARES